MICTYWKCETNTTSRVCTYLKTWVAPPSNQKYFVELACPSTKLVALAVNCSKCTVYRVATLLSIIQCIVYIVQFIVYSLQNSVKGFQYTAYSAQFTEQYTDHSVQFTKENTVYGLQFYRTGYCTVYSWQST